MHIIRISDEELTRRARNAGPTSTAAKVIRQLSAKRAKDRQFAAWQAGDYYFIGPVPDAVTEAAMIDLAEAEEE